MSRVDRVGLAVVAATALLLSGCGGSGHEADRLTVAAERTSLDLVVPAQGYLEAMSASPVGVPRVPTGALTIKELVPEGSIVEQGDIVIRFDDTQLNIELDNHKASFRSTDRRIDGNSMQAAIEAGHLEVMREVAELERDNAETFEIVDEEIFSKLEILETEVRQEEAAETILFAEASLLLRGEYYDIEERILGVEKDQVSGNIGRVETSLASLVLKAPIGGLIVYKKNWRGSSAAVGDTLWPGNVVMSIVDPASTALTAFVLEKDAAGLHPDAPATVVVDARPGREFRGRVATVAELSRPIERGSPVKYTEVKIELEDGDPSLLKPGMKGEARIVVGRLDDAVVVPRVAVMGEGDARFVHVASAEGSERRAVKLGAGDLVRVSIEEGLEGGERLLLRGSGGSDAGGDAEDGAGSPPRQPGTGAAGEIATGA
jgi:multidrug efflux pump subunit AcrA (membrane-fusion protein)